MIERDVPGEQDERAAFAAGLEGGLDAIGVTCSPGERELMWRHLQLAVQANRQFNLTRITSPGDAAVKHYVDSLTLLAPMSPLGGVRAEKRTVLDVGTGAGYPAIPLAIVCRDWFVTAIDGTGKKARFVERCAAELGLENVRAVHARAAELARQREEVFDLVLLRAVTQIEAGLAEVRPLASPGGQIVFYKTPSIEAGELQAARHGARKLGLHGPKVAAVQLRAGAETIERRLVVYQVPP